MVTITSVTYGTTIQSLLRDDVYNLFDLDYCNLFELHGYTNGPSSQTTSLIGIVALSYWNDKNYFAPENAYLILI